MKTKILLIAALIVCGLHSAAAGPRALGCRAGATGFEMSYQHNHLKDKFISIDAGVDFGYNVNCRIGGKATGIYNFIWAHPAWTKKGSWAIYAGPGLSVGGVNDRIVNKVAEERSNTYYGGFMISVVGQVGLEYNFEIPLQIAMEVRPMFGLHISGGAGFYDNGLLGFIPSLSLRYRF